MKFFSIALLTALAYAQSSTDSSGGADAPAPTEQNIALASGKGGADITSSKASAKVIQSGKTGTLEVTQDLIHNPAATDAATADGHVVVSFMTLGGAADNGDDLTVFGIALYDQPNGRAKTNKDQRCGKMVDVKGVVGPQNIAKGMRQEPNCTLAPKTTFLQTDVGDFHQAMVVGITETGTAGTLKLGVASTIQTGFTSYEGKADTAKQLDYWVGKPVPFNLEGSVALLVSGISVAAATVMTF